MKFIIAVSAIAAFLCSCSCQPSDPVAVDPGPESGDKLLITEFSVREYPGVPVTIDNEEHVIDVVLPYGAIPGEAHFEFTVGEDVTARPASGDAVDISEDVSIYLSLPDGNARKYVVRSKEQLVPTFTGFFVDSFLESTFPVYVGYDFTSRMEKGLDKIAGGEETKTAFLDRFWKGSDDFHGLHADLVSVSNTVRTSEVKSLSIPGLSYVFKHDDSDVHYSIRISKFGPYLASDYFDKEAGKNKMVSLDQAKYFPGTFTDNDAASILFPDNSAVEIVDGIYQMEGRYGIYYKRQSDGKIVNGLRDKKKALSPELIKLAFELPKSLGADEDEEEVILVFGPYGFYANYKGKNYPVANPESVSMEDIIKVSNGGKQDFPVIKDFGLYEDNPLQLLDGRYGPFIRWGKKNCALSKELKENPSAITEEDARKIASEAPEKKAKRRTARRTRKA